MIQWKPKKRQCKADGCKCRFLAEKEHVWWCSPECGTQLALAKLANVRAKKAATERKETRLRKQSIKPRRKLLSEVQAAFNWFIRERDHDLPCVSCRKRNNGEHQRHASHFKPAGSNPALRFDPANCHASCSVCNNHLSGNLIPYRAELPNRIGEAELARIEGPQPVVKWTVEELEAMKKHFNAEARRLQREREQRGMVGSD